VGANDGIHLEFTTANEGNTSLFEIWRGRSKDGPFAHVADLQAGDHDIGGGGYSYLDKKVEWEKTYWYYLVDVDVTGVRTEHRDRIVPVTMVQLPPTTKPVPGHVYAMSAYPNPFNPSTTISFTIPEAGNVKVLVYDVSGRVIAMLTNYSFDAGTHSVQFDGSNLATGMYLAKIESNGFVATQKLMLVR
jgi:hypothetical protein